MTLNVAVQMDPIERINIKGNSTFAMLLEAEKRGHRLSYYTPDRLALLDGEVFASVQGLRVRDVVGDHFTLQEPRRVGLTEFDVVLLRQDPPFDLAYITSTHLLERIHPKTLVVNDPASVRNAPEKVMVTEFPQLMPPTLITRDLEEIKAFRAKHGDIVMKPLYGHGGGAVFRLTHDDLNFGSLYDMFANVFREQWVVQAFLPNIKHGDKRIILVDGEYAGAVNRIPAADDLRSNMVRGGSPADTKLSAARARDLRDHRADFARARTVAGRHRRDRRQSHRDQRHVSHGDSRHQESRRRRHRRAGVGQDRKEARLMTAPALSLALEPGDLRPCASCGRAPLSGTVQRPAASGGADGAAMPAASACAGCGGVDRSARAWWSVFRTRGERLCAPAAGVKGYALRCLGANWATSAGVWARSRRSRVTAA